VVYDACVLYPALLRDFLVSLALAGAVHARWSRKIQEEWKRNLLENRPDLLRGKIERTIRLMEQSIPEAVIEPDETLTASLELPDPNDRHVLATAIRAGASVIVTFNVRDFPKAVLEGFGVVAQHPDELAVGLLSVNAEAVLRAVRLQRARLHRPPISKVEYLDMLRDLGLVETSRALAEYREQL